MLRKIAFAGCVLAGAGCLFADDPVQQEKAPLGGVMTAGAINITPPGNNGFKKDLDTSRVLFDNGKVNYLGVQIADNDLIPPAVLLYDNGGDNYANGLEMTNWLEIEDFALKAQSTVEHVDFSVLDTLAGNNLANWDGHGRLVHLR